MTRLYLALQAVVTIAAALLCEYLFARTVRPLMLPDTVPGADAQNRAILVMAMMSGAMVAMTSTFIGPMFASSGRRAIGVALVPASMFIGIAVGLVLDPIPPLAVGAMIVFLGGMGFMRAFGPWGFAIGQGLFMGYFLGFFLGRVTDIGGIGMIAIELGIGGAVSIAAQLLLFDPGHRSAARRLRASFLGRADRVAAATIDLIDHGGERQYRVRQHRRVLALNEAALMLDARLVDDARLPVGMTPGKVHRGIFSVELSLSNAARFARATSAAELPQSVVAEVRGCFTAMRAGEFDEVRGAAERLRATLDQPENIAGIGETAIMNLHRLAGSAEDYADARESLSRQRFASLLERSRRSPAADPAPPTSVFEPVVSLASGWLPGSSAVSATASRETARRSKLTAMEPWLRAGIQMTVAAAGAVLLGAWVSPEHFYWAVLSAFVTFMGENNLGENVRKGAFRVIGTAIGIVLGALIAHLVGANVAASLAVILLSLFIGIYLMRISYAIFAVAITVMVAQLYVQLGELSDALLGLRLLETLIGAGCAVLTVVFVLPLPTGRVARIATREFIEALAALVGPAIRMMYDPGFAQQLRAATRELDAAFQTLEASTAPGRARLRVPGVLGDVTHQWWLAANAAHSYARDLVADLRGLEPVPDDAGDRLSEAGQQLLASAGELARGLGEHRTRRVYTRTASQFERVANALDDRRDLTPRQFALRDLQQIDGALASVAGAAGLAVVSRDTPERS